MTELAGIDVSHWQNAVNWGQVQQSGRAFALAKATDGLSYVDPTFGANWPNIKAAGLIRGAYHYLRVLVDPVQQATHYLQTVNPQPGDFPPVLDVEGLGNEHATNQQFIDSTRIWLDTVHQKTGRTPMIYTAPSIWNNKMNDQFGAYPLWIANWGVTQPSLPKGFNAFTIWQYGGGLVNGIKGNVDLDKFIGTIDDLKAFVAHH